MMSVNTFAQCLHFLNKQAIPLNKTMDCFCSIYKYKKNIPNLRYRTKTSTSAMISVQKQYSISADNNQTIE